MAAVSISRALSGLAQSDPDHPAITCGTRTVTRGELDRSTNRLARAYAALGVAAGDYVTIALANSVEFYESAIAAWKLGAVPQPISHRLPQRERAAIIELARPALAVGVEPSEHPGFACIGVGWQPDPSLSDDELPDVVSAAWKAPTSGGSTGRPKLIVSGDPGVVIPGSPPSGLRTDG